MEFIRMEKLIQFRSLCQNQIIQKEFFNKDGTSNQITGKNGIPGC